MTNIILYARQFSIVTLRFFQCIVPNIQSNDKQAADRHAGIDTKVHAGVCSSSLCIVLSPGLQPNLCHSVSTKPNEGRGATYGEIPGQNSRQTCPAPQESRTAIQLTSGSTSKGSYLQPFSAGPVPCRSPPVLLVSCSSLKFRGWMCRFHRSCCACCPQWTTFRGRRYVEQQ